jgi:hypothetical protein
MYLTFINSWRRKKVCRKICTLDPAGYKALASAKEARALLQNCQVSSFRIYKYNV